jgi:hypothetical protein
MSRTGDYYGEMADRLKEGDVLRSRCVNGYKDLEFSIFPFKYIQLRMEDPRALALIGQSMRPGVAYLSRYLELVHYQVNTPRNDLMECHTLRWRDLFWLLTILPVDSIPFNVLERSIAEAGLRGRHELLEWSQPGRLGPGSRPADNPAMWACGFITLDLPTDRVIVLENVPGHLVYTDPNAAWDQQTRDIQKLEENWLPESARSKL